MQGRWSFLPRLPREIVAQMMGLLILSTIVFHICMTFAFIIGRRDRPSEQAEIARRGADIVHMVEWLPPDLRRHIIQSLQRRYPSDANAVDLSQVHVASTVGYGALDKTSIAFDPDPSKSASVLATFSYVSPLLHHFSSEGHVTEAFKMAQGLVEMPFDREPPPFFGSPSGPLVASLVAVAICFTLFIFWAAGALTRPLQKFASAVDDFSIDGDVSLLPESGPTEVRVAARALNVMRTRIKSMVEDRTRMLASVGHDLRTPITRIRLRTELIAQDDLRAPILRDLEQMNYMVNCALAFIRDGTLRQHAPLDLGALLQTVRDEFIDMNANVTYEGPDHFLIQGDSEELHRALANLVTNAINHGQEVVIRLHQIDSKWVAIDVSDDGPGIPDDKKELVLAPFVREDRGTSPTPGFGLGLPIVQTIVKSHGGSLALLDREPQGLLCRISLPMREKAE